MCESCRVSLWVKNNRDRSNGIKKTYVSKNPLRRKESIHKFNNSEKGKMYKDWWHGNFFFSGLRKLVLSITPYCVKCGDKENLHVHHRDGNGTNVVAKKRNNKISNLIVLCFKCHMLVHKTKEYPYYVK